MGPDLLLRAGVGLLQRDLEVVAQVAAARGARRAALAGEHVPERLAEDGGEDVVDVALLSVAVRAVDAGVPVSIVGRAFLRIREDGVGLVQLLELGFGVGAAGVAVRVVLHGELTKARLQSRRIGCPLNAQDFVIVARHGDVPPSKQVTVIPAGAERRAGTPQGLCSGGSRVGPAGRPG
jgi:hypothetical protein